MLKFRRVFTYKFSTLSDPYYILGVEKNTQFSDIKRTYYKLASQYHPDKNPTLQANKKFILIKQAFQSIKMQKGLMKPQNLYSSTEAQSMRPNPSQFDTDQQEERRTNRDYKVEREKTEGFDEYQTFNTSFKTISDIQQIKIKVEKGQVKDAASRFNIETYKGKIHLLSKNGTAHIFIFLIFTLVTIVVFRSRNQQIAKNAKKKELKQISKHKQRKKIVTDNEQKKLQRKSILESSEQVQQMIFSETQMKIRKGESLSPREEVIHSSDIESV